MSGCLGRGSRKIPWCWTPLSLSRWPQNLASLLYLVNITINVYSAWYWPRKLAWQTIRLGPNCLSCKRIICLRAPLPVVWKVSFVHDTSWQKANARWNRLSPSFWLPSSTYTKFLNFLQETSLLAGKWYTIILEWREGNNVFKVIQVSLSLWHPGSVFE